MANNRTIPEKSGGSVVSFTVKIDGKKVPDTIAVYSISIINEVNRVPTAKLTIMDGNVSSESFDVSSDSYFIPGKEIEILIGYQSQEDSVFKGVIVKHGISIRRFASQLKIECKDSAFKMTVGRSSRSYNDVKDSDVIETLIQKYGLKSGMVEITRETHQGLVQYDMADWDFMLHRADLNGLLLILKDGSISTIRPDYSKKPALDLQYGATIKEFDAEIDARFQYSGVQARGWDYSNQSMLESDGLETGVKVNGNLKPDELANIHGLKSYILSHGGNLSQQELQTVANAFWQRSRLAFCRGSVKIDGFANINPGDLLNLQGVGDRFNGNVFVSGIRHDVAQGEWVTSIQFGLEPEWAIDRYWTNASASSGLVAPGVKGLYTGVVNKLEKDPDGEDRIMVKIPLLENTNEGIWARIASLDAGNKRGAFFRPEIGDEVLVGFINNDPRDAVVIGMLNSKTKPAPLVASDENKEKGFVFKSKMKMIFNDADKSMLLETPGGNRISLSEKDAGIMLQDQNGNKLILNKDGITLDSSGKIVVRSSSGDIDLEGVNIRQKAQAQFKAEGNAGAELSSSAVAVLKGALVQIN